MAQEQDKERAQPVAGHCRFKGEKEWRWCSAEHVTMVLNDPRYAAEGYEVRYLYAAPQPNAALADGWMRKPLTTAEMEAGREAIFSTGNPYCPCDSKTFRKVAQWVERHHRIEDAPPTLNASKEGSHG